MKTQYLYPLLILFFIPLITIGQTKVDELILKNGDVIHGEFTKLQRNYVFIDADYGDADFKIDWDEIESIFSERTYNIYLKGGDRVVGSFKTDPNDSTAVIITPFYGGQPYSKKLREMVSIKTVDTKFIDRFTVGLSLGYTFTKAKNVQQFTGQANARYATDNWALGGNVKSVQNSQDSVADTHRTDGAINWAWTFYKSWFAGVGMSFLSNDEQNLKLRTSTSARIGNYIARSHKLDWLVSAGMAWTNERYINTETSNATSNSAEAVVSTQLSIFGIDDFTLNTNLDTYANLNTAGRYRADFTVDLTWDLPKGFLFKIGNTTNYDSKPVSPGVSEVDYVFYTTFGWEL
ncbi:DUF481 domain-containing protein [Persicobacter sp. CCB-QB2]|uniref:DUF481 domain-containing protein n=1 Tax=Persicobacter sp. CCB-QB2 TaxID=1561025 RepID=UPI0006A9792B|nr:DUF481 domain-containing protein [Persicobacter sp. CCB-QB2]